MGVAGAEVLVAQILERAAESIQPTILCLDEIGELGERLRGEGVDVVSFERQPGLDLGLSKQLRRAIDERQLDLVHAHQYTPFFYSALAKLRPGRPFDLVLTEHGRHYPDAVSARRRWTNRLLLARQASAITGCSDFSRRGLAEADGFPLERIELIPNGVEPGRYASAPPRAELRASLGLDPERTLAICVARFHPVKDHATLLRGFGQVAAERQGVDLILVGDGQLRGELERLAAELGIERRVRFLGIRHDVPALLQAADIFAMTSLSEAASLTVLEAMAAALPVVLTEVGGNPELVRAGREGLLVARGDNEALARALGQLLDDPQSAREMGQAGRLRVEESFRLDRTLEAYLALYRRVLGG
jgi:glycosyltransferase involved in cell wall biosynthesis